MPQSQQPAFQRVERYEWKLAASVGAERLEHLVNGPEYPEIIEQALRTVSSITYKRERLKKDGHYFRLVATLS